MAPPGRSRKHLVLLVKLLLTVAVMVALFRLMGIEWADIRDEIAQVRPARFAPWFAAAVAIKLVGIFANIWRWQLLLRGQDLHLGYGFLAGSFWVGRWFGIVTPGTVGLDGFRLYDSIRVTKRPVACAAVIVIDKVIGLLSLTAVFALAVPLAWGLLPNRQLALGIGGAALLTTAAVFATLLTPALTRPLLRLLPGQRIRGFGERVFEAATAYSDHRSALLAASGLAVVGHATTALMYWALLAAVSAEAVTAGVGDVVLAAILMTAGTLVAPVLAGEGVREFAFANLLAGAVNPARAVLFGHLGFWVEKALLGIPGGIIFALRREQYDGPITAEDVERIKQEALA